MKTDSDSVEAINAIGSVVQASGNVKIALEQFWFSVPNRLNLNKAIVNCRFSKGRIGYQ